VLFVATLLWSRAKQQKLLVLHKQSEQLERDRALILDMAARNEPLLAILKILATVTEKQIPGSVACFAVIERGRLCDVVAPGLPEEFLESRYVRGEPAPSTELTDNRERTFPPGLINCWSQEVLSNQGEQIGRVDIYLDESTPLDESRTGLLEGVAKLAGVVIQHREMYEQLAYQAMRDPLTGLPNRRLFQDRLEQAIHRANRNKEKVAVLLIDLDRFKQVNDLLGHRVGDALLCEVANRAAGCLRKSDTLSRIGGDEFIALLDPVESIEAAEQALRRIAEKLRTPLVVLDHNITVSASIGLSVYPDHSQDPATLLRNADLAMYHAKEHGKNGWHTYVPELGAGMLRRMSIEKALETAVDNGELELHYQAQVDFSGRFSGVEALLRWHNPQLGEVAPTTFIPLAEESGLIVPIGAWVLDQACNQAAAWLKAGFAVQRMAVNISARQLVQVGFLEAVQSALQRSGLSPDCLELELTETALMYDLEHCMRRLQSLRTLGVTVAIDDFGTGYSSLCYLQKLPVNRVKIDQSFVKGISVASGGTLPLVRSIIDLAHSLDLTVVAEGVETPKQFEALCRAGCDQMQGFMIHRPQPASEVFRAFHRSVSGLAPQVNVMRYSPDLRMGADGNPQGITSQSTM
jgi:diguanylate cyclase (GGDEF)-like protein